MALIVNSPPAIDMEECHTQHLQIVCVEFEIDALQPERCCHDLTCDKSEPLSSDVLLPAPQKFPRQATRACNTNENRVATACSNMNKYKYKSAHNKMIGRITAHEECGRWTCNSEERAKTALATANLIAQL